MPLMTAVEWILLLLFRNAALAFPREMKDHQFVCKGSESNSFGILKATGEADFSPHVQLKKKTLRYCVPPNRCSVGERGISLPSTPAHRAQHLAI